MVLAAPLGLQLCVVLCCVVLFDSLFLVSNGVRGDDLLVFFFFFLLLLYRIIIFYYYFVLFRNNVARCFFVETLTGFSFLWQGCYVDYVDLKSAQQEKVSLTEWLDAQSGTVIIPQRPTK